LDQWIHDFSFLFPALCTLLGCGSGRDEEPSGEGGSPPPDSDPFSDVEFAENYANLSSGKNATANGRFQFEKRRQLCICTHNETLSVVAMYVNNPNRSPVGIQGRDAQRYFFLCSNLILLACDGNDLAIVWPRDERDQLKREKQIHTFAAANGWIDAILILSRYFASFAARYAGSHSFARKNPKTVENA
jgi:hypothetical protein